MESTATHKDKASDEVLNQYHRQLAKILREYAWENTNKFDPVRSLTGALYRKFDEFKNKYNNDITNDLINRKDSDDNNNTLLHAGVLGDKAHEEHNYEAAFKYLLKMGANAREVNANGFTPLDLYDNKLDNSLQTAIDELSMATNQPAEAYSPRTRTAPTRTAPTGTGKKEKTDLRPTGVLYLRF